MTHNIEAITTIAGEKFRKEHIGIQRNSPTHCLLFISTHEASDRTLQSRAAGVDWLVEWNMRSYGKTMATQFLGFRAEIVCLFQTKLRILVFALKPSPV